MIRDSDLIIWFQGLILGKTGAGNRVYAWDKTPERQENFPFINVTLDRRDPELDSSRGAYATDRRLAVIIAAKGPDLADAGSSGIWVMSLLDDLEDEVRAVTDYDHVPPGAPSKYVMATKIAEVFTRRHETNQLLAFRFLIYSIQTADVRRVRTQVAD